MNIGNDEEITLDELIEWDKKENHVLVKTPTIDEINFVYLPDKDPHNYVWWCPPDCGTGTNPDDKSICLKNKIEWDV